MKKTFLGYYSLSERELKEIWKTATISLDTNVLFNLYRSSAKTRDEIISLLENEKKRFWLTHQVGNEYHKNRLTVIKELEYAYTNIANELVKPKEQIISVLNKFKRHPLINVDLIASKIEKVIKLESSKLERQKKAHPNYEKIDPINEKILKIFEGKIDKGFTIKELEKIYLEGEIRYRNEIPPGYADQKDKKKKGNLSLYGDLIIWKQLIKGIKERKKNLIFVTDDRKDDWWTEMNGKTLYPRPELIKEFFDETEIRILIYKPETFLKYSKAHYKTKIDEETIKEVKEIGDINRIANNVNSIMQSYKEVFANYPILTSGDIPKMINKIASGISNPTGFKYPIEDIAKMLNNVVMQKYVNSDMNNYLFDMGLIDNRTRDLGEYLNKIIKSDEDKANNNRNSDEKSPKKES